MADAPPVANAAVPLAAIAGGHGIVGEVRLKLFAESVASLAAHRRFEAGGRTLTLVKLRDAAPGPIARFAEVTTRAEADALRGTVLVVARDALPPAPPGEVYVIDLIGLPATADGAPVGRVVAIENYGAGDLVEVETPDARRFLVPFARCELADGVLAVDSTFIA